MEVLEHEHPLDLIDLQPTYPQYEEEYDDEDDVGNDCITKQEFRCTCDRCGHKINWFHRYYYKCVDSCNYSLHKFCAKLPKTLKHISHQAHTLTLLQREVNWFCNICRSDHEPQDLRYRCSSCDFDVDVNCAVAVEEKKIYHFSHPHPLVPISKPILCECSACGKKQRGIFYHCARCSGFIIHEDCALLPKTLLIHETTDDVFSHTHPLTISYSFPKADQDAKFNPRCRVCGDFFEDENLWIYKCEKCRYYTHVDCATSRGESFMSILVSARLGKTLKNFEDVDHPDLLHLPFFDEADNIVKNHFFKNYGFGCSQVDGRSLKHISHQHPLILVHTQNHDITRLTPSRMNSTLCHNPMKKIELICNGCMRPITNVPFYKCTIEDRRCNFVLHEWCTQLPVEVQNHPGHPQHTLVLLQSVPGKLLGLFECKVCHFLCNGFAYSCVECDYHVDVSCGFIPEKVTHKAHPNHLLSSAYARQDAKRCDACVHFIFEKDFSFSCSTCDFNLHLECALLLPQKIRHKYDKHPMDLSYFPIENHKSEYFCEICEEEFDPELWFYHCKECVQSIHSSCAPLILECETAIYSMFKRHVYEFVNIKFGGIHNNESYPHQHPLSFVQGTEDDGRCRKCGKTLKYEMIFKFLECKFAIDFNCYQSLSS